MALRRLTVSRILGALARSRVHGRVVAPRAGVPLVSPWGQSTAGCVRMFSSLPSCLPVAMPALSPSMDKGELVRWLKNEGDEVLAGDVIAEVQTDKAVVEYECQDDGYLARILVSEGTADIPVGQLVAVMVESEEDVAAFMETPVDTLLASLGSAPDPAPPAPEPVQQAPVAAVPSPVPLAAPAAVQQSASSAPGDRVFASPYARKLAREAGVDISAMAGKGTGPVGRIVASDIEALIASGGAAAAAATATAAEPSSAAPVAAAAPGTIAGDAVGGPRGYTDIPHTSMRSTIAARLTASKLSIPHYYLTSDVTMDATLALRARFNRKAGEEGVKLSVNDFIVKAAALACKAVPEVNSSWLDGGFIRSHDYVDVNVAVAVPDGIVTPVVKDAHSTGLAGIASAVHQKVEAARAKSLTPADVAPGTFTISNLGMYGLRSFSAIINPPQAAILAVGAATKRAVVDGGGGLGSELVMSVTLSCDHRVIDGAVGAQWLAAFRGYLEDPETMLL